MRQFSKKKVSLRKIPPSKNQRRKLDRKKKKKYVREDVRLRGKGKGTEKSEQRRRRELHADSSPPKQS